MASCKDCIHYKPCFSGGQSMWNNIEQTEDDHCKWLKTEADIAEVKHGAWKQKYEKAPRYVCSSCNHLFNNKEYNYCPNCGARMDGKVQEEVE